MISGITEKEENIIKEILSKYPYEFYYYGSRVKGDFSIDSDLDILLVAETEITQTETEKIDLEFNKSLIPYKVNICQKAKMEDYFYKMIEKDLVKI
ncbi:nucleotidyltransferase domain-containing protein [bacterium]|nr:nucleotidyltransferase domain-containing protein [bacterium]